MISLKGLFQLLIIALCTWLSGCRVYESHLKAPRTFYHQPERKFWAHRVNTVSKAKEALKYCNGIELDVHFSDKTNELHVGHDRPFVTSLENYLDSISSPETYYYWIDFKNLSKQNAPIALARLKKLISKYHLENRLVVESKKPGALALLACPEIFTCYWVPNRYHFASFTTPNPLSKNIERTLQTYRFDAISGSFLLSRFFVRHFKGYNVHLYSHNRRSEKFFQVNLPSFTGSESVKVILMDDYRQFYLPVNNQSSWPEGPLSSQ